MNQQDQTASKQAKTIAVKQGYIKAAELLGIKPCELKTYIDNGGWPIELKIKLRNFS